MKHYFKKQVNFLETNEMYMFYTIRYLKGHPITRQTQGCCKELMQGHVMIYKHKMRYFQLAGIQVG